MSERVEAQALPACVGQSISLPGLWKKHAGFKTRRMQYVYTYEVIREHQRRGTVDSADVHLNGDIGALSRGGDAGDG